MRMSVPLHQVAQLLLVDESRVSEMEVVFFHAVVATCCLTVVTVLRQAELGNALAVFALVHNKKCSHYQ